MTSSRPRFRRCCDGAGRSWRLCKFLWAPRLGLYGLQRIHLPPDAIILAGAGVGGGSLNYANTLYVPPAEFFGDSQWAGITDWASELAPYYDQASRMLGVTDVPAARRWTRCSRAWHRTWASVTPSG